ncbi:unnamed protein product [Brassica oleracea]
MDSGQLPEPDPPEPPDRPSSPVRPSSSDKSSTPSNFSPSPNLISPKELQSRTLPLFFSILHLLSSPLSVLFTRIIPEGRSKPEIFSNFTVFCPRGSWPSILSPFQAKGALHVDSLVLGFGSSSDLISTFISVGSMHFVPQPVTTCTGCSTSSPPHTVQFHAKH